MELVGHHDAERDIRKKGAIRKLIFDCICLDFSISKGAKCNLPMELRN